MTDRNTAYKAEVNTPVEDDPLAELARIVGGNTETASENPVSAPPAPDVEISNEMDLEAELMRELGDELDIVAEPTSDNVDISQVTPIQESENKAQEDILSSLESDLEAELMGEIKPESAEKSTDETAIEVPAEQELVAEIGTAEESAPVSTEDAQTKNEELDLQLQEDLASLDEVLQEPAVATASSADIISQLEVSQPETVDPVEPASQTPQPTEPNIDHQVAANDAPVNEPLEQFFEENFEDNSKNEFISQATPVAAQSTGNPPASEVSLEDEYLQNLAAAESVADQELPPEPVEIVEDIAASLAPSATAPQPSLTPDLDFGEAFSQQIEGLDTPKTASVVPDSGELEQGFADAFADELDLQEIEQNYADSDISNHAAPQMDVSAAVDPAVEFADEDLGVGAFAEPSTASGGGRGFKMALGALGVALIAGLGVVGWGAFNGTTSDSDAIIIKANNDPVKVKPADPGGKKIANTENKVYESVAGNNSTETQQDSLVDSTQTPIDISKSASRLQPDAENENGNSQLGGVAAKRVKTLTIKQDGTIVRNDAPQLVETVNISAENPVETIKSVETELALAETQPVVETVTRTLTQNIVVDGVEVLQPVTSIPDNAVIVNDSGTIQPAKPIKQTQTRTVAKPTPIVRTQPATTTAVDPNAPTIIAALPTQAPAATPVARSSGWSVQISSQRSAEAAQRSYANLRNRFSSVLGSREVSVQRAVIKDKGTFYRVKIPASSKSDANSICTRLKRAGGSCFVTR